MLATLEAERIRKERFETILKLKIQVQDMLLKRAARRKGLEENIPPPPPAKPPMREDETSFTTTLSSHEQPTEQGITNAALSPFHFASPISSRKRSLLQSSMMIHPDLQAPSYIPHATATLVIGRDGSHISNPNYNSNYNTNSQLPLIQPKRLLSPPPSTSLHACTTTARTTSPIRRSQEV